MKHTNVARHRGFFKPMIQSAAVQSAMMVLQPGQSSSEQKENEHPKSEQWLFVISGSGRAKIGSRSVKIEEGSLLLIEKGEPHQVTNTGTKPLSTINFYCPVAYSGAGDVKPSIAKR